VCACEQTSRKEIQRQIAKDYEQIEKPEVPCGIIIQAAPGHAEHIGVYIGNQKMIHISMTTNVVVDRIFNWKDRIMGYYKYVGNTN
jgi:cell wall-associated NlpC family hydrolase